MAQFLCSPLNNHFYRFDAILLDLSVIKMQSLSMQQAIANTASRFQSDDSGVLKNKNGSSEAPSLGERRVVVNPSMARKIPENLKLSSGIIADVASSQTSNSSTGPYIAISDCISGNPLIDRDNPTTPLNSLDPKFYDTPRSHFNIGLNLTNEQPYSPKRNNIQSVNIEIIEIDNLKWLCYI